MFFAYSIAFHYLLSRALDARQYDVIWKLATAYGTLSFATGAVLGVLDPIRLNRGVQGFQYHFVTYVMSCAAGWLWFLVGGSARAETWQSYFWPLIAWGAGVWLHYLLSRTTIKGMSKNEIFD